MRRAIEDNVLRTCSDLVARCVAVGHLKPCVVLIVEPVSGNMSEAQQSALKSEILKRTAEYNSRLQVHERITDPSRILVVPGGSLPRTSVSSSSDVHSRVQPNI